MLSSLLNLALGVIMPSTPVSSGSSCVPSLMGKRRSILCALSDSQEASNTIAEELRLAAERISNSDIINIADSEKLAQLTDMFETIKNADVDLSVLEDILDDVRSIATNSPSNIDTF